MPSPIDSDGVLILGAAVKHAFEELYVYHILVNVLLIYI